MLWLQSLISYIVPPDFAMTYYRPSPQFTISLGPKNFFLKTLGQYKNRVVQRWCSTPLYTVHDARSKKNIQDNDSGTIRFKSISMVVRTATSNTDVTMSMMNDQAISYNFLKGNQGGYRKSKNNKKVQKDSWNKKGHKELKKTKRALEPLLFLNKKFS